MSNFQTAIVDADFIKYAAAACGETRSILVINNETGDEYKFKTRTEFYGRGKAKNGGWLGEYNLAKDLNLSAEDFTIQDVQTKLDFSNCTNVVDYQIKSSLAGLGTKKYKAFIGRGDSFRVERSTLLKYKGHRTSLLKPLYLKDVEEYLIDKYNGYLEKGVAREIARVNLPLSLYTMYVFKMDVRNLLNFLTLRFDSHAQYEIRQYAIAMADMMEKYFPLTIEAWRDYHKNSINFSDMEIQILRDIFTETENFDIIKKVEEKMDEEDNKKKLPNIEKDEFMDKVKKLMGLEVGLEYLGKEENQ